jgi:hypothetical protein
LSSNFYNENAKEVSQQYLSMCFDEIHQIASNFSINFRDPDDIMLKMRTCADPDLKYLADSVPQFSFNSTRLPKNKKGP